ncbi:uncharacterized protein LOC133387924 [Rhineura floridana]|uniref:uncharacterized protein LOC133387924 n=1 Tax=Rhineura floridana TaxID=261503 RepID=UPI002AC860A2|nr:uncharacterized protein LOC133387924 [Rhineura floridana]
MGGNRLKLNPDKTEVLLVGDKRRVGDIDLVLNGVRLPLKDQVRSLGVILDSQLSMEAQISAVSWAAWYQLHLIQKLRPYLPVHLLPQVVHAPVSSRLDYCNALYVGLPLKTVRKQLVQNASARLLKNSRRWDHITPVLKDLHWLPVVYRAQFKVLVLTFKALYGVGPVYLKERLQHHQICRLTRSASQDFLSVPPVKTARLVRTRERTFSVVAPTLWNSLPYDLRHAPSLPLGFLSALTQCVMALSEDSSDEDDSGVTAADPEAADPEGEMEETPENPAPSPPQLQSTPDTAEALHPDADSEQDTPPSPAERRQQKVRQKRGRPVHLRPKR